MTKRFLNGMEFWISQVIILGFWHTQSLSCLAYLLKDFRWIT